LPRIFALYYYKMKSTSKFLMTWASFREPAAFLLCLGMIIGFFWSRATLSVSIILLFTNSLYPGHLKENWEIWKRDKFSIACLLFFLAYFLSGFWSQNYETWWDSTTNKLPFLVLPFAFLSIPFSKAVYRNAIVVVLLLLQTAVIFYSLSQLLLYPEAYIQGYNFSHVLPTTKYNDHIRFSLSLVLSLLIIFYLLFENAKRHLNQFLACFLVFCAILFIIYLHILAVKSGLLCLYLMAVLYVLGKFFKYNKALAIALVLIIVGAPFVAYYSIPTFQKKVDYVRYEYKNAQSQDRYNYNFSDQGRMLSYKMGWKVLKDHFILGTGAGDLKTEMNEAYQQAHPEVPLANRLIPHNQFLYTAVVAGFFLSCTLLFMCLASFFQLPYPRMYGQITSMIMVTAFMAEAMLEVQFGVFVYLFFILFWRNLESRDTRIYRSE